MDFEHHPLYRDAAQVRAGTEWHLAQGHTVFQLFQFEGGEAEHSRCVLELACLPRNATVLSLGSGVAGMEAHWLAGRPDLTFELVNYSPEQLALSLCPGRRVVADAQGYVSEHGPFDCVVVAYMLGHVDALATLQSALRNVKPGGRLVVLDVFDSTPEFDAALTYTSPTRADVRAIESVCGLGLRAAMTGFKPTDYVRRELPATLLEQTTPALFVLDKPCPP
jgi:SAM-dependent methyltransferase